MPIVRTLATLVLGAAALVLPGGAAHADVHVAAAGPNAQDQSWLVVAHQGNLAEVAAGREAVADARSDAVRRLGQMIVDDHIKLDAQVTAAAQQLGVTVPSTPSKEQQVSLAALQATDRTQFDQAWISSQIADHRAALEAAETERSDGADPTVTGLAAAAAPVVQRHLDQLQEVATEQQSSNPGSSPRGERTWWFVSAILVVGIVLIGVAYVIARRRAKRRPDTTVAGPDIT